MPIPIKEILENNKFIHLKCYKSVEKGVLFTNNPCLSSQSLNCPNLLSMPTINNML